MNEKYLKDTHAKYHAKCSLDFNNRNYIFAQNRSIKREKKRQIDSGGKLILERPKTRSKVMKIDFECTSPPEEKEQTLCFFYGHIPNCPGVVIVGSEEYRRACTSKVHTTVQKCAEILKNSDLIAKLAFGDMHSQDAIYHASCHTAL